MVSTSMIRTAGARELTLARVTHAAAALLLAVGSSGAAADVWFEIGVNDRFTSYADPATIKRQGNRVTMWSMFDYKTAQATGAGKKHLSVKRHYEYDCAEQRARLLTVIAYAEHQAKGEKVAESDVRLAASPVAAGTADERLFKYACTK